MKTINILLVIFMVIGFAGGTLLASDKYYVPSWGMATGEITDYPKGHTARVDYTPNLAVNYDKQHMPWFESTLKPQNLRREGSKDFVEEAGKLLDDMFHGRKYEG